MKKSPISVVKEKYDGEKAKLVAAVRALATDELWLDRVNATKGLAHVSNAKLLRLVDILGTVKERFGSRAQLIDAILALDGRSTDGGYKARLAKFPTPRLFDHHEASAKRARRAARKAAHAPQPSAPVAPAS
ncbi:MAG: hypothetical protein OZ921_00310 [Sorangiineae bacterium]|nr:hypothetical protein [Polyangiaceae bacterium]MEB2320926.1 hypothetical protein [Sorangiineae bacterium]